MNGASLLMRALVTGYARSHALRALVTLCAVALGVATAYAIDLANATAVDSFSRSVNVIANHVNLQVFGNGEGFDERSLLRIQTIPGVESANPVVEGELVVGAHHGLESGEIVRVEGIDATRSGSPPGLLEAEHSSQGFNLHQFLDGDGIIISRRIAESYHAPAGALLHAYVSARAVALPVMGVIPAKTVAVDSSVAFTDIATAQKLFDSVGRLERIDLVVDPPQLERVRRAVERVAPPGARVLTPKTRLTEIKGMLSSFTLNLAALADVALLVGMYLIYNAVAISVVQRTAQIGTLRALGTRRRSIFATFAAEGAVYGVAGSIVGLALGFALSRFSVQAVEATVSTLYLGAHADNVVFSGWATVKAFALGTGLSTLAAAIPAAAAARVPPAGTMRASGLAERRRDAFTRATALAGVVLIATAYLISRLPAIEGVAFFGYISGLLAIAGVSCLTPLALAIATIPLRRVGANADALIAAAFLRASPRRISVAVASLATAVAMMIAIAVLVGSFRSTIVAWTHDTLSADLYVSTLGSPDASLRGGFTQADVVKIRAIPGVAGVDTFRGLDVTIGGEAAVLGATDLTTLPTRNRFRFLGRPDLAVLARELHGGSTAIVSEPFSTHFGLRAGDRFTILTPSGPAALRIVAVYNDYSTSGGTFFIDRATFVRLFHDPTYDSMGVYLDRDAQPAAIRSAIERALAPERIDINTNRELRSYALAVFDQTFAITNALYLVSIVIAVLGVVSTLFALVLERTTDIALLRYIGSTRSAVRRMVLVQALVVGVLAGVLGIGLGVGLAADLIYVINRQSFGWLIEWRSPGWFYLEAFAAVVIAAIVAAIYPAQVASSIRTGEVLRAE
jgi:putative ABC transport system permease protein